MNILFVTIAWPDKGKKNLYTDLMHTFRDNGHSVHILASQPKRSGKSTSYEQEDGMDVLRVKTGNVSKTGPLEKSLSLLLLGWQFKAGVRKYLNDKNFDLILFNTPPVTLSGFLKYLKKKFNCPLYLLLKDMWPYGFADNGLIKENGVIYKYFKKHEKRLFEISDNIGCMSPAGVEFVLDQYPEMSVGKVEVCPNSIKIEREQLISDRKNSLQVRTKYGIPEDATVFIFSGNLGLGHGLDFLTDAILELRNYEKAFFLIGGAGTHFAKVKLVLELEKPANAMIYSYMPQDDYNELIATCDVGLILLSNRYSYPQFPSRLLSYLESKMAVLCAVNEGTDIGEIIEESGAGLNTLHGDMEGFTRSVRYLSENPERATRMGKKGYDLLREKYDVQHSCQKILNHFV